MIKRLWHWLTWVHEHEWEVMDKQTYEVWTMNGFSGEKVKTGQGMLYTLRCKGCGEITTRKAGV